MLDDLAADWFASIPTGPEDRADGFLPTEKAPFLGSARLLPDAALDRNGVARPENADPGPIEAP